MPLSPSERSQRSRLAVLVSHAQETDPAARTAPARQAFKDRFERQVDPDGILPEADRLRRADFARRAYYTSLAFKSAKARRAKAAITADTARMAEAVKVVEARMAKEAKAKAKADPAPTTRVRRAPKAVGQ
jgi:hypothetical protein